MMPAPHPPDPSAETLLRHARRVLAVVAHPDDESFGLGGVLATVEQGGAQTSVLCFTHGEASTLHAGAGELGAVRAQEFAHAAVVLGVDRVTLLAYPDGALAAASLEELVGHVILVAQSWRADLLVAFDEGGVTGHPDHQRATEAARCAANVAGLTVMAWAIPAAVASALNSEFSTAFVGRMDAELGVRLTVDRRCQLRAIAAHRSQSTDNPVLRRRLELLGDAEWLRVLPPGWSALP